jgi:hypothetical protein
MKNQRLQQRPRAVPGDLHANVRKSYRSGANPFKRSNRHIVEYNAEEEADRLVSSVGAKSLGLINDLASDVAAPPRQRVYRPALVSVAPVIFTVW